MNKKAKHIITYFSLFIGLVIFSHAVIPHDHHFQIFNNHSHTGDDDDNSGKNHAHCFYLNDVIIQKSDLSSNIINQKHVNAKDIAIKGNIKEQESLSLAEIVLNDNCYCFENDALLISAPVRGSPFHII